MSLLYNFRRLLFIFFRSTKGSVILPEKVFYTILQLFGESKSIGSGIIQYDTWRLAILIGIAGFFLAGAVVRLFRPRWQISIVLLVVGTVLCFVVGLGDVEGKSNSLSEQYANEAISSGVDMAQKAQATELQYIHANVIAYGYDTMTCTTTRNRREDCGNVQPDWANKEEVNISYTTSCDSKGKNCTTTRHSDWDYTPWFSTLVHYWIRVDTKAKYLLPQYYAIDGTDPDKDHVKVYVGYWLAPQGSNASYDTVPDFWLRVQKHVENGLQPVVATFIGTYFNWGFASSATEYITPKAGYEKLRTITTLPGPTGLDMQYRNSFGGIETIHTLLTTTDGLFPLDFQPVSFIGTDNVTPQLYVLIVDTAMQLQGYVGPHAQASIRWFVVPESYLRAVGTIDDLTAAFKAYLEDQKVWGHFKLPKNQIVIVTVITDDGTKIVARGMATGIPFGNTVVMNLIKSSVTSQSSLPFTPEYMIGRFSARYVTKGMGNAVEIVVPNTKEVGQVAGMLLNVPADYVPPDPNSKECGSTPELHTGFIRVRMCSQSFLQSTIQINKDGAELIYGQVREKAYAATTPWWVGVLAILGAIILWLAVEMSTSDMRRY